MKTLLIIFAILVVALLTLVLIGFPNSSSGNKVDIAQVDWRLPETTEKGLIEKTFLLSEIDSCKKYYIKKILENHFIVACPLGSKWVYYTVFTDQKRVFFADDKIVADLTAPVNKEVNSTPKKNSNSKTSTSGNEVMFRDAR